MKAYLGFDDTDTLDAPYGTGKLVRWFQKDLPRGCVCRGVVRQQLLVCDEVPYTSHNSAACMVIDMDDPARLSDLIERAVAHLETHALPGSDPGLCAALADGPAIGALTDFGHYCTHTVATRAKARAAAQGAHLSGHGGTLDGIIGAAAAVGLTASGWSGRFIELGNLRDFPEELSVSALRQGGIQVVSVDRDAGTPAPSDRVLTNRWLRPRLLGDRAVLLVEPFGRGRWININQKRKKAKTGHGFGERKTA